jgi:hypothetical protein
VHDDHLGVRVADHVLELGWRMGDGERNRDAARAPDPPLCGDVGKTGRREEGDAHLGEVVAPGQKARRDPLGRLEELAIREGTF